MGGIGVCADTPPVRHVRGLVAPAVGIDHVAVDLEGLQIVAELATDIQSGLVDQHGHGDWMQLSTGCGSSRSWVQQCRSRHVRAPNGSPTRSNKWVNSIACSKSNK